MADLTARDLIQRLVDALDVLFKESVTTSHNQELRLGGASHPIPIGMDLVARDTIYRFLLDEAHAWLDAHPAPLAESPAEEMIAMPRSVWELFQRHCNSGVPERYCPTHGQQPPNAWGCPECVRELRQQVAHSGPDALCQLVATHEDEWYPAFAEWLEREVPEGTVIGDPLWWASKIADYLARYGHPPLRPTPISERLPLPEECDAKGRCWIGLPEKPIKTSAFGAEIESELCYPAMWMLDLPVTPDPDSKQFMLPAHALPLPANSELTELEGGNGCG